MIGVATERVIAGARLRSCPEAADSRTSEVVTSSFIRSTRLVLRLAVPASGLTFKPGMALYSLGELPVRWGEP
jgi:hypothetical protein